jgi:transposase-like protein
MISEGASIRQAARAIGISHSTAINWWRTREFVAFHEDGRRWNGRRPSLPRLTAAEMDAVRALALATNRSRVSGSVRVAIRLALDRGLIDPARADMMRKRDALGLPMLPRDQMRALAAPEPLIRSLRTHRDASWSYCSADGALPLLEDDDAPIRPGQVWTCDDATINFAAVVQMERPGDPCWDRWGVMVGRFQIILLVDHRSYFIPAFIHTARPHQQYRAEDVLAALGAGFRAHGLPQAVILERGISAANRITESLDALDIRIRRARTPHTKVAEWVFNKLWTLLSHHPGQLGRGPGDDDRMQSIYQRCRRGELDPRGHFLPLTEVLQALQQAIRQHNEGIVESRRYGRWCPAEWWAKESPHALRPFPAQLHWAMAPVCMGPVKVHGMMARSTIRLMDTHSTLVTYAAPELVDWHGARVLLWADPWEEGMPATITLAEDWRGHKAGLVIGRAEQIDAWARYTRRALMLGNEPDIGASVVSRCRHVLRRRAIAMASGGGVLLDEEVIRRPDGSAARITRDPGRDPGAPASKSRIHRQAQDPLRQYLQANPATLGAYEELFGPLD